MSMWLSQLLERLFAIFPRLIVIRLDEGGFRQTPKLWGSGCWVTEMKPGGWYWLWPIVMEHEVCSIKTQVVDIRVQSALTKDGRDVAVGLSIRYYISDPMKALLQVHDYDQSLNTIALGVACNYIQHHNFEEIRADAGGLRAELLSAMRKESAGWGLRITDVALTDIGRTRNLRLLNSTALVGIQN